MTIPLADCSKCILEDCMDAGTDSMPNCEFFATDAYPPASSEQAGGSTPSQYAIPSLATDLQDLIEYREMNFARGNIFKACYRSGHCDHSDELREARKMLWFAQREVNRLESQ